MWHSWQFPTRHAFLVHDMKVCQSNNLANFRNFATRFIIMEKQLSKHAIQHQPKKIVFAFQQKLPNGGEPEKPSSFRPFSSPFAAFSWHVRDLWKLFKTCDHYNYIDQSIYIYMMSMMCISIYIYIICIYIYMEREMICIYISMTRGVSVGTR